MNEKGVILMDRQTLLPEEIRGYLDRIGVCEPVKVDLESLNRLLAGHLYHIPFDSMDIWATGCCPSLALGDLYRKMIVYRRGGYCFEQNTLFRVLLCSLGFDAWQSPACLVNPDGSLQPPAHNGVFCRLAGTVYFLDVGFGGPVPRQAMALEPGYQQEFLLRENAGVYTLLRQKEGVWIPFLQFRTHPVSVTELQPLNFYISQKPDSHFRHILHVSQRRQDGSLIAVEGTEFRRRNALGEQVCPIENIDRLRQILVTEFGMAEAGLILREEL